MALLVLRARYAVLVVHHDMAAAALHDRRLQNVAVYLVTVVGLRTWMDRKRGTAVAVDQVVNDRILARRELTLYAAEALVDRGTN